VANYGINIDVKVKTRELTNFNLKLKQTNERVDAANKALERFVTASPRHIRKVSQSFSDLNAMVNRANEAFNKSTLGTPQAVDAAKNMIRANEQFNVGLEKRAKLLEQVTFQMKMQNMAAKGIRPGTMYSGPIGPGQATSMFGGRVKQNIAASQAIRGGSGFAAFSSGASQVSQTAKTEAIQSKARAKHLKNIDKKVAKIATIQTQQQSSKAFGATGGQIGPALPGGFRLQQQFKEGGLFGMPGGMKGRIKGGVGSALIGGGFPALFGAGGISSAMGAVAGGAGGALAPGGGFAASIFATAIAAQIEKAIAFNKAVDDLNVSIAATGGTSLFSSKQVAEFAKSLGMTKDEALEALKAFKQFEAAARITLTQTFGSEGTFDIFTGLKDNQSVLNALPQLSKELSLDQAKIALDVLKTNGARSAELKLLEQIFSKNKKIIIQESEKSNLLDQLNPLRGGVKRRSDGSLRALTIDELETERGEEAGKNFQSKLDQAKALLQVQRDFNKELERQAIIKAPVDELERLLDPLTQIDALGKSIGDSFSESFKGLIRGSMTAQEALRNLFQRTADHFADMAAQMLAAQLRTGIFGLFKNFLTPSLPSTQQLVNQQIATHGNTVPAGSFGIGSKPSDNFTRAMGGPVTGGNSYLVGERGPEMFSPGVSGMITPNHALGGGTSVVVNVDASGSSVEGDEDRGKELGRLISVAVQSELINEKRPGGLLA